MPDLVGASSVTGDEWSDIGGLSDLLRRRPAFHADAACREAPPEVSWFIERGGDPGPAKAICQRCLVVDDCRAWALDQGGELEGVWGGLSKADRRTMR
ncbi:MAG: WhiB family transcriptional regulator, partial [Acidimicrobiales bacterium]